jgi:predicted ABC-type ATPase
LLLREFKALVKRKETFALESTLSGLTYLRLLKEAKRQGFRTYIHYLWLPSTAVAIRRVHERVRKGGHNVPAIDIRRRFRRGLIHFVHDYAPLAERWAVWNTMKNLPELLTDSRTCALGELRRMLLP